MSEISTVIDSINDPDVKAYAQALQAQLQQQAQQLTSLNDAVTKHQQGARLSRLNAVLQGAPDAHRAQVLQAFEYMQFNDNDAFETYLTGVKSSTEEAINAERAKGGIFTPPTGNKPSARYNNVNPYVQERADERNAMQGKNPAIKGL